MHWRLFWGRRIGSWGRQFSQIDRQQFAGDEWSLSVKWVTDECDKGLSVRRVSGIGEKRPFPPFAARRTGQPQVVGETEGGCDTSGKQDEGRAHPARALCLMGFEGIHIGPSGIGCR